jgi:hypothetical protein
MTTAAIPKTKYYCLHCPGHETIIDHAQHRIDFPLHKVIGLPEWNPAAIREKAGPPKAPRAKLSVQVPPVVDLRPVYYAGGGTIKDQGAQGSCTAQAGAYDTALTAIKLGIFSPSNLLSPNGFSAAYLYWHERNPPIENWDCQDSGAYPTDINAALGLFGICLDRDMPYNPSTCVQPNPTQDRLASNWKWDTGAEPLQPEQWDDAVYQAQLKPSWGAVRIAVPIPASFMQANSNGGYVPLPNPEYDQLLGGHEMLLVGRNENLIFPDGSRGGYILLNSWGTSVGDHGIYYMPFAWPTSQWVMNNGGTFAYQGFSKFTPPTPPPPSPLQVDHTYIAPGTYNAQVIVTDANGKSATSPTIQIIVTGTPQPFNVVLTAVPNIGPAPLTSRLTATPDGGTGPYSAQWIFGD